ncbi:uncharacterized protein METZ01_LOCUS343566, partial [marine metagenome]
MLGAMASFLMIAVGARELSDTMNTFQIVFLRSLVGFGIILLVLAKQGIKVPKTGRLKIHIFRNILHYSAQAAWILGVSLLPLATVFAIEFTTPIWVALMAVLLLNERLNRGRLVAILFGLIGTLIILRPGLEGFGLGHLAVLWAAVGYGATYVITKMISNTEAPITILFYMTAVQAVVGLVPGLIGWVAPKPEDIFWIGSLGVLGLTSHFCLTKAFIYADATLVLPIDFLRLPLAAVVGFFFYQEAFELAVLFGGVVIFAG